MSATLRIEALLQTIRSDVAAVATSSANSDRLPPLSPRSPRGKEPASPRTSQTSPHGNSVTSLPRTGSPGRSFATHFPQQEPTTFGTETRFRADLVQAIRARQTPDPLSYSVSVASQLRSSPAPVWKRPLRLTAPENLIKISEADRDKPLADALRNTLARNAARVVDLFVAWDADGNGMLDKEEFGEALGRMGLECSSDDVDEIWGDWDTKGEGELTLAAFSSLLKRHNAAIPKAIQQSKEQVLASWGAHAGLTRAGRTARGPTPLGGAPPAHRG